MLPNDPASDPEVERVARLFCADAGLDPDALDPDGEPLWRRYVQTAVSSIAAWRTMVGR